MLKGGSSRLCICTSVPPPKKGVVSEGNPLRIISWTPGPSVSLSSLLCFAAKSTKTSSFVILAFPAQGNERSITNGSVGTCRKSGNKNLKAGTGGHSHSDLLGAPSSETVPHPCSEKLVHFNAATGSAPADCS